MESATPAAVKSIGIVITALVETARLSMDGMAAELTLAAV
jgi:hypothetical protein